MCTRNGLRPTPPLTHIRLSAPAPPHLSPPRTLLRRAHANIRHWDALPPPHTPYTARRSYSSWRCGGFSFWCCPPQYPASSGRCFDPRTRTRTPLNPPQFYTPTPTRPSHPPTQPHNPTTPPSRDVSHCTHRSTPIPCRCVFVPPLAHSLPSLLRADAECGQNVGRMCADDPPLGSPTESPLDRYTYVNESLDYAAAQQHCAASPET